LSSVNLSEVAASIKKIQQKYDNIKKSDYWQKFKGLPFYCGLEDSLSIKVPKGSTCCFMHNRGLPLKNGVPQPLFDYEWGEYEYLEQKHPGLAQIMIKEQFVWIKKATGMGITEFFLYWLAWMMSRDDDKRTKKACIVTGIRVEIGIGLMERLKAIFYDFDFPYKSTYCEINGCPIEAYPSNHSDSIRALPNVWFILVDEGDFFRPSEQKLVVDAVERYIGKSGTIIVWVSTPNLPGGLFDRMEKDATSMYYKIFLHYTIGVGKIYNDADIILAKKSRSFGREYGLIYGVGVGNIFPLAFVDAVTMEYSLIQTGVRWAFADPAFANSADGSKFGVMKVEFRKRESGEDYFVIIDSKQVERASPIAMTAMLIGYTQDCEGIDIDSAHPGLIRDLQENDINASEVIFKDKLDSMSMTAPTIVKEKLVQIHPGNEDLLAQMKAVETDAKGHPDKKKLNFDIGDCFLMACDRFKYNTGFSGIVKANTAVRDDLQKEVNEILREEPED
jgi:hypothetical protein